MDENEYHLPILAQVLGPEHPDTLMILNNLALLYRAQGRYEEAEMLRQKYRKQQ